MRFLAVQILNSLALLLAAGLLLVAAQQGSPAAAPPGAQFTLMTSAYSDGANIPVKYSCDGKPNAVSPALQWSNPPSGAVSFTLILHDADAHAAKSMWDVTHWIVWNIPGSVSQLPEGVAAAPQMPDGTTQGVNVRGVNGYQGPCAAPGKPHHYTLELYALDTKLDLGPTSARADVMKAMDGHIIGKAVYIGMFHR